MKQKLPQKFGSFKENPYICTIILIKRREDMEQILVTIDDTQKAYVKESLSRALQEVKLAKLQGKKLQDVDDFIREMKEA
ncbi:hypothetical protein DXD25_14420 [Prevotella sp. TF12-30]|jgi:hypothetical protein|nr:hypothetical protein DXD25_14420 [Prevotella sp. TF12-30]